ncbi:MAG: ATP-binding cassette domain-containing protein [Rubripirellula sp.]
MSASAGFDRVTTESALVEALLQLGMKLSTPVERSSIALGDGEWTGTVEDVEAMLSRAAVQIGFQVQSLEPESFQHATELLMEGMPIVTIESHGCIAVLEQGPGRRVEINRFLPSGNETKFMSRRAFERWLRDEPDLHLLVVRKELECEPLSAAGIGVGRTDTANGSPAHHAHPSPLERFLGLLRLDRRDVWTVVVFALVAGILSLATPLAVETLVSVVSWGTYWQPLVVLAMILLACLGLSGVLRVLQTIVVEIIQRRQLVRIVGDLSHRFPRANQAALEGTFPRELANRVFDIITIQKASAALLLDGISIVLTTALGLLLLAFYHPFLLGFDLVLMITMISVTWLLGRGGVRTAVQQSITKYRIAAWLQDVLANPTAFKVNGGGTLAVDRANRLVNDYLYARRNQFRVIIRQVIFAVGVQVVASTALLGLGGWLVIRGQLTLGQLVASELVVTVVVGAFAKAGKSLEKFYDLMAGIDKVGHLLDLPVDPRQEICQHSGEAVEVRWDDLTLKCGTLERNLPAATIEAGSCVAITDSDRSGGSLLARSLAGLVRPQSGVAEVGGIDAQQAYASELVCYAGSTEIFHGSLRDNVDLGRSEIGRSHVREVLRALGLWSDVIRMGDGLETLLQSGGHPLSETQCRLLMIARAIVGSPPVVIIDGLLDDLPDDIRQRVWNVIADENATWTLLLVTSKSEVIQQCEDQISVRRG